jgi:hypothetical protein
MIKLLVLKRFVLKSQNDFNTVDLHIMTDLNGGPRVFPYLCKYKSGIYYKRGRSTLMESRAFAPPA